MRTAAKLAAGAIAAAGCLALLWGAARGMTQAAFIGWGVLAWLIGCVLSALGRLGLEELATRRSRRSRGRRSA